MKRETILQVLGWTIFLALPYALLYLVPSLVGVVTNLSSGTVNPFFIVYR